MSAREEILNGKRDILNNLAAKNSNVVDQLFENYRDFAKANWNYAAQSGKQTADDLKKKLTAQQYAGAIQNRVLMVAGIK